MGSLRAILLVAVLLVLPSKAHSADQIKLSIYVGHELDFCPGGYANTPKCVPFTSAKFEELLIADRIRLHDVATITLPQIRWIDQPIVVQLSGVLRSLARRARAVSQVGSARSLAVLLVAEWIDGKTEDQAHVPFSMPFNNPDFKNTEEIFTSSIPNRRSFSHGSLRSIDPEERYPWVFARGTVRMTIFFR